jgi:hypothetical protein
MKTMLSMAITLILCAHRICSTELRSIGIAAIRSGPKVSTLGIGH